MIFMAKVCPKAINFATAESIHQLLALRPHPTVHTLYQNVWKSNQNSLKLSVSGLFLLALEASGLTFRASKPAKGRFSIHLRGHWCPPCCLLAPFGDSWEVQWLILEPLGAVLGCLGCPNPLQNGARWHLVDIAKTYENWRVFYGLEGLELAKLAPESHFGCLESMWSGVEISMNFKMSRKPPQVEATRSGDGKKDDPRGNKNQTDCH